MVVLEGKLVFSFLWHLYPYRSLANTPAFGFVGLQQVFPAVTVEAALAEVLLLFMFVLVIQQPVKILDPCVVELSFFLDQQ